MILIALLILLITLGINYSNFYEGLFLERKANLIFKERSTAILDAQKQIIPLVTAYLKHPTTTQDAELLKTNYRCGFDLIKLAIPLPNQPNAVIQIYLLVANKELAACKYPAKINSQVLGTQIIYGKK